MSRYFTWFPNWLV